MEKVSDFILGGSKITADGDCSHEIKRCLLLGRKAVTNLDSILKGRDIKNSNIWRLNNMLLNNQQITEEIKKEIKICTEMNENENTTTQNLWDTVKAVLRGKFQRRQWYPTPVLLPRKSHGWRSLVGCSPWGR